MLLLAVSVTALVVGLAFLGASWGLVMTIAGGLAAAVCCVGVLLARPSIAFIGLLVCGCGGLVAAGLASPQSTWAQSALTVGLLGVVGLGLLGAFRMLASPRGATGTSNAERMLGQILEASMLSDTAKRIIYRDREMALLRRTIEEDIERGDFNAGLVLCRDLERLFGYSEEAEQLRNRVLLARNSQLAARIDEEVRQVEGMLESGELEDAETAAARLHRMYPDSPGLHGVEARIRAARQQVKRELKQQFINASSRGDTQGAMELLRQLDRQIGHAEAVDVQEAAAEVIAQHREALSVRFKLAVSDHRWAEAVEAGSEIINQFPNDRMAAEVRGMIDRLRERAATASSGSEGAS